MRDGVPSRLSPDDLLAGRYRLLERVERAGFGEPWRARDERDRRVVDLHDLGTPRGTVGLEEATSGLREVGAVKHRMLVLTTDAFVHAGGVVVVVPAAEGVPLAAWMEARARGGIAARLEATRTVVDQIAQGIGALHRVVGEAPLAHGAFGGPCVRVEMRGTLPVLRVESHGWGRVVAPPAWWVLPPEGEAQTPAADVFALGVWAATWLAGPSAAVTPEAVRHRFEQQAPEVDASVIDAVVACLHPDPTLRLPDARAARERLTHTGVHWKPRERPVSAPPPRRVQVEDEAPVVVEMPPKGPKVWLVPSKSQQASQPPAEPPETPEESTQVEPPRAHPKSRPVAKPRTRPAAVEEEATVVDAPHDDEERTDVAAGEVWVDDEATDVGGASEARRSLSATRRVDLPKPTPAIPAPVQGAPTPFGDDGAEETSPLLALPNPAALDDPPRERTLIPRGRRAPTTAFVPDEPTSPMTGPPPGEVRAPEVAGPVASMASTQPRVPTVEGLPVATRGERTGVTSALVVRVVVAGVWLGLVLWWAIR